VKSIYNRGDSFDVQRTETM